MNPLYHWLAQPVDERVLNRKTIKWSFTFVLRIYVNQSNISWGSTKISGLCQIFISEQSSSSRMRFMSHNCSAMKQRLHPQSIAKISSHSVWSEPGFANLRRRLALATSTQISVSKSPFPSASNAASIFPAKTVHHRPLVPRWVKTCLWDCGVTDQARVDHFIRRPDMHPWTFDVNLLQI